MAATFDEALKLFRALPRWENITIEECQQALDECEGDLNFATPFVRAKVQKNELKGETVETFKAKMKAKAKQRKAEKDKAKKELP